MILPVSQDAQVLNEPAFFVSIAQALEKQYDGARIRVSKGSVITSLEQTPRALMEAQRAIYIENLYPEALPYIDYSHLGFQRLLYEISDIELLRRYVADTIGPLLNYDSEHGTDYYGTLLSYYRMIRNVAKQRHSSTTTGIHDPPAAEDPGHPSVRPGQCGGFL